MPPWLESLVGPMIIQFILSLITAGMMRQMITDVLRRVDIVEQTKLDKEMHHADIRRIDERHLELRKTLDDRCETMAHMLGRPRD